MQSLQGRCTKSTIVTQKLRNWLGTHIDSGLSNITSKEHSS